MLGLLLEFHDPIFNLSAGQFIFDVICVVILLAVVFWVCKRLGIL